MRENGGIAARPQHQLQAEIGRSPPWMSMAPHSLPRRSPPWRGKFPARVANALVVCFACVSDVVLRQVRLSAGVVGTLASWFAISCQGGWVHGRKFCEGGAKATSRRAFER